MDFENKETEKIEKGVQEVKKQWKWTDIYYFVFSIYFYFPVKVRVKVVMCQKIVFM